MATIKGSVGGVHAITTAQVADGASDNVLYRKYCGHGPVGLVITNVAGGSPTTTVSIQGSMDNTNWFNIAYSLVATPTTYVVTNLTITSSTTTTYLLKADEAWMYLRTLMASTNNETVTVTAYP